MNGEHPNSPTVPSTDERLLQELREHAATMEVSAFDFLDRNDRLAGDRGGYTKIRITFQDGKVITLPRRLEPHFRTQQFKLRPARDDA